MCKDETGGIGAYRFGLYVDGVGPYGVSKVSGVEMKRIPGGSFSIEPLEIESAIYEGKAPEQTLFSAIVSVVTGVMKGDEQGGINIEIHAYETIDNNAGLIWKLNGCKVMKYSVGPWDAMDVATLKEKIIFEVFDIIIEKRVMKEKKS
jgi:hypothetical protein